MQTFKKNTHLRTRSRMPSFSVAWNQTLGLKSVSQWTLTMGVEPVSRSQEVEFTTHDQQPGKGRLQKRTCVHSLMSPIHTGCGSTNGMFIKLHKVCADRFWFTQEEKILEVYSTVARKYTFYHLSPPALAPVMLDYMATDLHGKWKRLTT